MAELPKITRWPSDTVKGEVTTELVYVLTPPVLPAGLEISITVSQYVATIAIAGEGRFKNSQMLQAAGAVEGWMRNLPLVDSLKSEIARGSHVGKPEDGKREE